MSVLDVLSVVGIGLGTVFVGLICLVGICKLIGLVCAKIAGGTELDMDDIAELVLAEG